MSARFFGQEKPVKFVGQKAADGLAFRWYDPNRKVLGKRMEDHLRFAVCYWHSFTWPGTDPFGGETFMRPWMHMDDPMAAGPEDTGGAGDAIVGEATDGPEAGPAGVGRAGMAA